MRYEFSAELWLWDGKGAWHFVTLPQDISAEIKEVFGKNQPGFGSVRVNVKVKDYSWKTSIFPDNKSKSYLLPIKAEVRKKTGIRAGDQVDISLDIVV